MDGSVDLIDRRVRVAVRALVAVTAVLAAATLATAQALLPDGLGSHTTLIVFLPLLVAPGALIWHAPRPAPLATWSVVGWFVTMFWLAADKGTPHHTAGWPVVATLLWIVISLVLFGLPIAAFVIASLQRSGPPETTPLARRLRAVVQLAVVLAVVASAIGFLPGQRIYRDRNDCFGEALGAVMSIEGHHRDCTPDYSVVDHEPDAGGGWLVLFFVVLFAPAVLVYRIPQRRHAVIWIAWAIPLSAIGGFLRLFVEAERHSDLLWPTRAVDALAGTLIALVVVVQLLVVLITRSREEPVPEARLR